MDLAEAYELAARAKSRVKRGGARAISMISAREIEAMARVCDRILEDWPPDETPAAAAAAGADPL